MGSGPGGAEDGTRLILPGRSAHNLCVNLIRALGSALLALAVGCGSSESGKAAPDFTVERAEIPVTKAKLSDFKGKVVVIDFWASWCDPCKSTMPALERVYQKYKGKGVEFTQPVKDAGFGLLTAMRLPGGDELYMYQPKHATIF